jgi:hypothetical protein
LWSFGIFYPFWYFVPRKIWQPCLGGLMAFFKGGLGRNF